MDKKSLVEHFLKKGILVTPDFLDTARSAPDVVLGEKDMLILSNDLVKTAPQHLNWKEFERSRAQKDKGNGAATYSKFLDYLDTAAAQRNEKVKVLFSYKEKEKHPQLQDFVSYFTSRLTLLESILAQRSELSKLMAINKIRQKRDHEAVSMIGIVQNIEMTKNKNIIITLEDLTGTMKVMFNKNRPELWEMARNIVLDEAIGVHGMLGDRIVFANALVQPDIPLTKPFKKASDEAYAIFLSDLHVGSKYFLEGEFNKFLNWINLRSGNEAQRALAAKVSYIFIIGDLVDGVGIYPNQEKELVVKDIYQQYEACASFLSKIPSHIPIIICAGNHDAVRLSEPQPQLSKEYAAPLWGLPNVIMVSNPSCINIHASDDFSGFDVLMYHGYSFDYYIANVDSIRFGGGYDRPDLIMKFLLQKRHLAPSHTSTLYVADPEKDNLVIDRVPDFFVTGHLHKSSVSLYRNITLICGSCWQSTTAFQEKLGHHPEPCRVPVVNLKTRAVKVLKFGE